MNRHLEAWLLEGTEPPDGVDLDALLSADGEARGLADDLDKIDVMAGTLPELAPPDELDAMILARIRDVPQDAPSVVEDPPTIARPANTWWRWVAGAVAVAAAALLVVSVVPRGDSIGNPGDWTPRGEVGAGPGVDLSIAVRDAEGSVQRFRRSEAYDAGHTLLFRYDAHASGWLHLVRVDERGAEVIHVERVQAGQGDLRTPGGLVGYELEDGESTAVFALIRHSQRLSEGDLHDGLAVEVDREQICAAARGMGGRCAAEVVEAVP